MTKANGTCPVCGGPVMKSDNAKSGIVTPLGVEWMREYEQLRLDYDELADATASYIAELHLMLSTGKTGTEFLDKCADQVVSELRKHKKREEDKGNSNDKQAE